MEATHVSQMEKKSAAIQKLEEEVACLQGDIEQLKKDHSEALMALEMKVRAEGAALVEEKVRLPPYHCLLTD